jgi:hypothetical protein
MIKTSKTYKSSKTGEMNKTSKKHKTSKTSKKLCLSFQSDLCHLGGDQLCPLGHGQRPAVLCS